jgi:hypothetical protein
MASAGGGPEPTTASTRAASAAGSRVVGLGERAHQAGQRRPAVDRRELRREAPASRPRGAREPGRHLPREGLELGRGAGGIGLDERGEPGAPRLRLHRQQLRHHHGRFLGEQPGPGSVAAREADETGDCGGKRQLVGERALLRQDVALGQRIAEPPAARRAVGHPPLHPARRHRQSVRRTEPRRIRSRMLRLHRMAELKLTR